MYVYIYIKTGKYRNIDSKKELSYLNNLDKDKYIETSTAANICSTWIPYI